VRCPPFSITLFEYSNIGKGIEFMCDPATGSCKLVTADPASFPSSHIDSVLMTSTSTEEESDMVDEVAEDQPLNQPSLSDDEESDEERCGDDEIQLGVSIGKATGVVVATQGQI
jgi:hypothetical protein